MTASVVISAVSEEDIIVLCNTCFVKGSNRGEIAMSVRFRIRNHPSLTYYIFAFLTLKCA